MVRFTVAVCLLVALMAAVNGQQRFVRKCELAWKLRQHGVQNLAAWVCLAEVHTNGRFDTLHKQGDGYGLWEISSRNFCRDGTFQSSASSRCNLDCDRFWDTDFEDDIRCFTQVFTERGFADFRGWKVRHSTCPNLKTYLTGCGIPQ